MSGHSEVAAAVKKTQYAFDRATDTEYVGTTNDGVSLYSGSADADWCIGDVPHVSGGVLAIVTDAVLRHFSGKHQKDPIALNCFFMHKTEVGPCVVAIEDLKTSKKGYWLVKASLLQPVTDKSYVLTHADEFASIAYKEKVHAIFTMGNMDTEEGVTYLHEPYQPPDRSIMEPFQYFFMGDYVESLLDQTGTAKDGKPGKPEFNQSIKFKDGRETDFKAIPYWCDMFIPPPGMLGEEVLGGPCWCPTMQLEVQFKRRPACKEVIASIVSPHIINGRFDASGGIWDLEGNLIALTRHQCLIVPWSRNTKREIKRPKL
ncbi:thioesterase-like superfamily-domain-containing protein [Zychaea mexicana]|uniref:thioesterase-like superfamily-domain-containing protein n=1 Tax=Zychaea mexicana TaxID=64656 RepID=UPI0022FEDBAD|nr:thioesterase-like superfamily-domain-containing protein [Zychaea mexicana]KAI9495255.1 thioesterase-like superfamily-domain-containing protein [Zychaea mexicana]